MEGHQACRRDACLAPETVTLSIPVEVVSGSQPKRIHAEVFAPFTNQEP
jgi:hypothetical protein